MVIIFLQSKLFKFLVWGGVAAFINLVIIFFLIENIELNTPLLKNVANIISIELSLLASFFIYYNLVWNEEKSSIREIPYRQLFLYHISAGLAIFMRVFLIFPLLEWLKISYLINTLVGILVSAFINYSLSDRFVFKSNNLETKNK